MKQYSNTIRFTRLSECYVVTVIEGIEISHVFMEHFHRSFNIGLLTDGEVQFRVGSVEQRISQGTLYLINPMTIHSFSCQQNYSYLALNIPSKQLINIFHHPVQFKEEFVGKPHKTQIFISSIRGLLEQTR